MIDAPECAVSSLGYDRPSDSVRSGLVEARQLSKDDVISPAGEETHPPESSTATSAGHGAPAVVAVMVASDPGDWFERTLESLAAVEYENFAVLVIDNAADDDLADRMATVLPRAFVKRLDSDGGFSSAANQVLSSVEGASFYLFLHDDVALESTAVTELVAEAFRANAAIVGPKIVDWDDPSVLRSVGVRVDPFGFSSSISEPGELDQAQHDTERYVFAVSDTAMLVRADLFAEIGGFDEDIPFFGEAVDLCWRAHLAGASVAFAPAAVVAHRERFDERRHVTNRQRLETRNEARTMLRNYSLQRLLWITPVAFVLSVVELLGAIITGRVDRASDIAASWFWNLFNLPSLIGSRRRVRRMRRVPDSSYTPLMRQGSSRLRALVRADGGEHALRSLASTGRGYFREARSRSRRGGVMLLAVAVVVLLYGTRHLIAGPLPALREFPILGRSGGRLVAEWFSGWRHVGLGEAAVAPPAVPISGLLGWLLLGSVGAARRLLLLGPLVLGAAGAWRLLGKASSTASRAAVLTAYSLNPVILGAVGGGRLAAIVTYSVLPWAVRIAARDSGIVPFAVGGSDRGTNGPAGPVGADRPTSGSESDRTGASPDVWRSASLLGLLVALVASFTLLGSLLVVGSIMILAVVVTVTTDRSGGLRMLRLDVMAFLGALVVLSPWIYTIVRHGDWHSFTGLYPTTVDAPSVGRIITGSVGPVRSGIPGWGLVLASLFPLIAARSWRAAWATGVWLVTLSSWTVAVILADVGLFGGSGLELILVPASFGLATALGIGVISFEEDVLGFDFGFQQILAAVAGVVALIGLVPVMVASTDGRWFQPRGDFDAALQPLDASGGFRTLWVGDPDVLPVAGWMIDGSDLAVGLSTGLDPTLGDRYRGDGGAGMAMLTEAMRVAADGQTSRLGRLLGPMGIRYVVVVDRAGPVPFVRGHVPMPERMVDALRSQLDLVSVDVNPAMVTFEVQDVWPLRGAADPGAETALPSGVTGDDAIRAQLWEDTPTPDAVLGSGFGTRFRGDVPGGSALIHSVNADPGWRMTASGGNAPESSYAGWAQMFTPATSADSDGPIGVDLRWSAPLSFRGLQLIQIVAVLGMVTILGSKGRDRLRVRTPVVGISDEDKLVSIGPDGIVPTVDAGNDDNDDEEPVGDE